MRITKVYDHGIKEAKPKFADLAAGEVFVDNSGYVLLKMAQIGEGPNAVRLITGSQVTLSPKQEVRPLLIAQLVTGD